MKIIDSLECAKNSANCIDGNLGKYIETALEIAITAAGRVSYRLQRVGWKDVLNGIS